MESELSPTAHILMIPERQSVVVQTTDKSMVRRIVTARRPRDWEREAAWWFQTVPGKLPFDRARLAGYRTSTGMERLHHQVTRTSQRLPQGNHAAAPLHRPYIPSYCCCACRSLATGPRLLGPISMVLVLPAASE